MNYSLTCISFDINKLAPNFPRSRFAFPSTMHCHIFSLIFILSCVSIQSLVEERRNVVSVDLIHRDSTLSPFYNHSISPSELLRRAVGRSFSQATNFNSHIHSKAKDIESKMVRNEFEYLIIIFIGSNHYKAFLAISTGSQLIWFQCDPCEECYKQDAPIFKPSDTYNKLPFDNEFCRALPESRSSPSENCIYKYAYGKKGSTSGILSTETFLFNSTKRIGELVSFPEFVFGCGHKNKVNFDRHVQGVAGLGRGKLSLISQLGSDIEQIFSYCLIPRSAKKSVSKLRFGQEAKISGERVSVLLSFKDPSPYYYLTLKAIGVGSEKIKTNTNNNDIIIDSGTFMTLLHPSIYDGLEKIIIDDITKFDKNIERTTDPTGTFSLCYEKHQTIEFPTLEFHFAGADVFAGAKIQLNPTNTFVEYYDYMCMAIAPHKSENGISVLGSFAQVNFHVEYDLNQKLVSFAPTDCTEH